MEVKEGRCLLTLGSCSVFSRHSQVGSQRHCTPIYVPDDGWVEIRGWLGFDTVSGTQRTCANTNYD